MNKPGIVVKAGTASMLAALCMAGCHRAAGPVTDHAPKSQASEEPASDFPSVMVDANMARRLGLELATVTSSKSAAATHGTAVVLDSAAYAATMADIDAARSEAATAHDNYQRLQGLYSDDGNASRQAVETADTQLSTAHARVATAEARARSEWGAQLVDAGSAQSTLRRDLANGRVALLRAEFANALPGASDQLEYALLTSDPGDSALHPLVFLARSSAPAQAAGGPSVLLRLKGEGGNLVLRPGARFPVIAALSSGPDRPVVPAAAALADGGQFWCYVARDGGKFERVPLASIERVAGGYPVAAGVKAGDQVVVRGAPLLLSLERGAGSVAEAE